MKKAAPIIFFILLLNLALLSSSICVSSQLADSPWPMFHGNTNHTGLSPYNTSHIGGGLIWNFTVGGPIYSSIAIGTEDLIYVGSRDGNLYAIYPNGTLAWNFTLGSSIGYSSPAIDSSNNIYIGSTDHKIHSISQNGTENWAFTTGAGIYSSPTIGRNGIIYIGSLDNKLYAIYPNGTQKWNFTTQGSIYSSAAINGNSIFVGSTDGKLYAINFDGSEIWNFTTGDSIYSSPAIDVDGTIYFGSHDNNLYALNSNGTLKWRFMTPDNVFSSPALDSDGTIYFCLGFTRLYAVNPNGMLKWVTTYLDSDTTNSSPTIGSDGTIYFRSDNQILYAIDKDGEKKWHFDPLYGEEGSVLSPEPSNAVIGRDGTIYFGTTHGLIYAIGPDSHPLANFTITPETGNTSTVFYFNAFESTDYEDTPDRLSYEWDFGDGNTSTGIIVNHTYGHNGNYSILLTVVDSTGKSDNYTLNLSVNDSQIIKQPFILKSGLIIYGMANLIPLFLFVYQQRRNYKDTEHSDIDPAISEAKVDDVGIVAWFLSRRILIYWFAILMMFDVITTFIALSKGVGYELNPFGQWLFNFESGYAILLLLKFIAIILLAYVAFRIFKVIKQHQISKDSMWYFSEINIWIFMIGAMIFTVGNNLNVIL